jgi:signal transduction histidine kinase
VALRLLYDKNNIIVHQDKLAIILSALGIGKQESSSVEKLVAVLDLIPQIILVAEESGIIEYSNKHWHAVMGEQGVDCQAIILKFVHPDDIEQVQVAWQGCLSSNTVEMQFRLMTLGNGYRWFLLRGFRGGTEVLRRWFVTLTDINEQKLAEEKLLAHKKELCQLIKQRDLLLGIVSHDLKSPLMAIGLSADLLIRTIEHECSGDGHEKKENVVKNARFIKQAVKQSVDLVSAYLDLAALESGQMNFSFTENCPRQILERAHGIFSALAEEKGLSLGFETRDLPEKILCDRSRMDQVLANLIGNAIKYTPGGGKIWLKACSEKHGGEQVIVFSVSDNGPGVPIEDRGLIFDRFRQGRKNKGGTGLGLAIAKAIVEGHKGVLSITDSDGGGACFKVLIPVTQYS